MAWTIDYAKSVQKLAKKLDPVVPMRIRQFLEERSQSMKIPASLTSLSRATLSVAIGDIRSATTGLSAISRTNDWWCW